MSVAGNQQRTLISLLTQLRPYWRRDRNLPARIQTLLSRNRSFGSRDRRLYRELIYTTLRFLPWLEPSLDRDPEQATRIIAWLAADAPATENFRRTLLPDWPVCPLSVAEKAAILNGHPSFAVTRAGAMSNFRSEDLLPSWLQQECPEAFHASQIDALHTRAPLWLRADIEAIDRVTAEFDQLGWRWQIAGPLCNSLQIFDEADVTKTKAFAEGMFEVQDVGSQLLLESAGIQRGERWLDACAGAGGKTLQLAQLIGPSGRIDAFDTRQAALEELFKRAARARLKNVTILKQPATAVYDGVLVDAPCTGSGTWRRAPHLKWTTTSQQIVNAAVTQRTLLADLSERVRPGGRLLYATCSLNQMENETIVADFLATHPRFASESPQRDFGGIIRGGGLTLLPALHNTDGFFIAAFRRLN
jgi:16S rRNA (cytosine967-C5)-methyltransferase